MALAESLDVLPELRQILHETKTGAMQELASNLVDLGT